VCFLQKMQVLLCCLPQPALAGTQAATHSSVRFGVQEGNVQRPAALEWELRLLRNLRKQAQQMTLS
jgi:hypothetical protein